MKNKLGCASVKLLVWLEFVKVLKDLINFGWWMTMLEIVGPSAKFQVCSALPFGRF